MIRYIIFWITGLFFLSSCSDDDNFTPDKLVTEAFNAKYPSASQVEWETKNSYLCVDFIEHQLSNTAWFDQTGHWYMTETELNHPDLLPAKVLGAFRNSEYATWTTDDIDRLERQNKETLYIIEVRQGKEEYDLYYSEDGILLKVRPDSDEYEEFLPQPIPAAITELINSKYPGARIIDTEQEHTTIEVDIIFENQNMEIVFNLDNEWLNTHYEVSKQEVDPQILENLSTSEYSSYSIDDIEKYETPTGTYYLFELEKGESEIDLKIDGQGNITRLKMG